MWKHYTFENATPLRSFIAKYRQYWQGKTIDAFYVAYSRQSHNSWRRVDKYYFEDLSYAFIVGEHAVIVRYFFDSELTLDIVDAKLLRDEAWLRSTGDSFPAEWKSRAIIWRIDAFPYLHTPVANIDMDTAATDDVYFALREPLEYTPMAERLIRGDYFIAFCVRFANGHIMRIDNRSMVRANRYQTFPATGYSKQEIYAEVDQHIASYLEYDFSRKVLLADPLFDVETTIVNSEVYGTYLRNFYADFYHSNRHFTEDDIRDMIEYAEFLAHALRSNIMQVDALGIISASWYDECTYKPYHRYRGLIAHHLWHRKDSFVYNIGLLCEIMRDALTIADTLDVFVIRIRYLLNRVLAEQAKLNEGSDLDE